MSLVKYNMFLCLLLFGSKYNTFSCLFLCTFSVYLSFAVNFVRKRVGSNIIRFY
ncbi:hypothetical protein Hanom_Chr11g00992241 [Helianthus anomalus]